MPATTAPSRTTPRPAAAMDAGDERDAELQELLAEVRRIDVQASRLVTDLMAGGYASVFRGAGIEFDRVREYEEGDDPRSVDWNVTARMGRPFVKTYVDERELTMLFLLDLSASMQGGFGPWSLRQMAARVCACLALAAVRNGDKVGLAAFSRPVERYVRPAKGAGHALRIVRDCLALPGTERGTDPRPALEFAARVVRRRAVVFVVSDFLGWDDGASSASAGTGAAPRGGWQDALAHCARRHDVIAVRLLPPELDADSLAAAAGLLRVRDPETGETTVLDASDARVRRAFAARVGAWRDRTTDDLRRAKVDVMDVPLPRVPDRDAVARPILRFFAMRERRGEKR
jgi:uncharacterized protein (DUF58 family)